MTKADARRGEGSGAEDISGVNIQRSKKVSLGKTTVSAEQVIIFQLDRASGEDVEAIVRRVKDIPTDTAQGRVAGIHASQTSGTLEDVRSYLDRILERLDAAGTPGEPVKEARAGALSISRVDLLVRKAVLLKSEAAQMPAEHVKRKMAEHAGQASARGAPPSWQEIYSDFDHGARNAKVTEAYALLEEAHRLAPDNTEILLLAAELLLEYTPDDPSDEQTVLRRIRALLMEPKDDEERFRWARATLMLAISAKDVSMLRDAREAFERLGRSEFVHHCDELLAEAARPKGEAAVAPAEFQPVGRWQVQVMDRAGSVMTIDVAPDGTFQASQWDGVYGSSRRAAGYWSFLQDNRMLQLQGLINGLQSFGLGIAIQGEQGERYHGIGTDGFGYLFTRG